jgi:hypothetical protein
VQEVVSTHRADLAIAEEAGQSQGPKFLLHNAGIVVGHAEEVLAPAIATTQATTVNGAALEF